MSLTQKLANLIDDLIPVDICRRHRLLPLSQTTQDGVSTILVAMVDPENLEAQDDLNRIFATEKLKATSHGYHR